MFVSKNSYYLLFHLLIRAERNDASVIPLRMMKMVYSFLYYSRLHVSSCSHFHYSSYNEPFCYYSLFTKSFPSLSLSEKCVFNSNKKKNPFSGDFILDGGNSFFLSLFLKFFSHGVDKMRQGWSHFICSNSWSYFRRGRCQHVPTT